MKPMRIVGCAALAAMLLLAACGTGQARRHHVPFQSMVVIESVSAAAPVHTPPPTTTTTTIAPITITTTTSAPPAQAPTTAPTGTALASWYAPPWGGYTFASRSLARGTRVRFTYHGRAVVAACADYGPMAWTGRTFDLSTSTFEALAPLGTGVLAVGWTILS